MIIIHVHIHVKPESVEAFKTATLLNARLSLLELRIRRFDFIQQADDATRFVLMEVYRDDDAIAEHKETPHYAAWRDAVAPMMAEPRTSVRFGNLFPGNDGW